MSIHTTFFGPHGSIRMFGRLFWFGTRKRYFVIGYIDDDMGGGSVHLWPFEITWHRE